jgi:hypothetical protein
VQSVENRTGTERKKEKNKGDVFIHITVRERMLAVERKNKKYI